MYSLKKVPAIYFLLGAFVILVVAGIMTS